MTITTHEELDEYRAAALNMDENRQYISCPFCQENDFDLIGLRLHLLRGHCDIFNKVPDDD